MDKYKNRKTSLHKIVYVTNKFWKKMLDKIKGSENSLLQVYVLLAVYDMSDCVNYQGEDAGEQEEIKGIFTTMNKAEERKNKLDASNEDNMNECNCDSVWFKIVPWDVE